MPTIHPEVLADYPCTRSRFLGQLWFQAFVARRRQVESDYSRLGYVGFEQIPVDQIDPFLQVLRVDL